MCLYFVLPRYQFSPNHTIIRVLLLSADISPSTLLNHFASAVSGDVVRPDLFLLAHLLWMPISVILRTCLPMPYKLFNIFFEYYIFSNLIHYILCNFASLYNCWKIVFITDLVFSSMGSGSYTSLKLVTLHRWPHNVS